MSDEGKFGAAAFHLIDAQAIRSLDTFIRRQAALFETFGLGGDQLTVAKILADPSLSGERAALEYMSKKQGSRATFYRIKKELELLAQGVPMKRRRIQGP